MSKRKERFLPSVRVSEQTRERIARIAEKRDVPIAHVVREAVSLFLSKNDNSVINHDTVIIEKGA